MSCLVTKVLYSLKEMRGFTHSRKLGAVILPLPIVFVPRVIRIVGEGERGGEGKKREGAGPIKNEHKFPPPSIGDYVPS